MFQKIPLPPECQREPEPQYFAHTYMFAVSSKFLSGFIVDLH